MEKLNLPPFYVGETVEAISTSPNSPRKKGDRYKVIGLAKFMCGCWAVDVGFVQPPGFCDTYCDEHGPDNFIPGMVWHQSAKYFRSLQEQNFPLISLSQIKEKETVEVLAAN